jgi:hypothetical protein
MESHGRLRQVFERAFSAQDLAQPLLSFDGDTPATQVASVLKANRSLVAGIRTDGRVTGFVEVDRLSGDARCSQLARPIEPSQLVPDDAPLASLVQLLRDQRWVFVQLLGQVGGVVRREDFQQAPARMWLFGMVTLLETRFSQMIAERFPDDSWRASLSEGRVQKAEVVLADRSRRNPQVSLIDCLQWTDKIDIIAGDEQLRGSTRFASKREIRDVGKQLERLRNNLAHSQDIVADGWDTIVALSENLDSVVAGPRAVKGQAP